MQDTGRKQEMKAQLEAMKAAQSRDGVPSAQVRRDRLDRAIAILVDHRADLSDAIDSDFGQRSATTNALGDFAGSVKSLKHARKNLARWMKPEKRGVDFPFNLLGARARVDHLPKGVVGIMSPWNFPVAMVFQPLAGVLAAGNRAIVKPSEFTEATSALMAELIARYFDPEELTVFTGGPDVGAAFSQLPFDHIVFTGATSIARHVMRAAAENLVPLTLELGGKSPAILGRTADMERAAARIMAGKTLNSGQICLAPDYALTPQDRTEEFVGHAKAAVADMYPTIRDNPDYTAMIDQRHYDRMMGYLEDARDKGAEVVEINPAGESFAQQEHRKIPPHLILEPTDDMLVMREEIFGPLLPVKSYQTLDEAMDYVNGRARPLGLYAFGDGAETDRVVDNTVSGGVTVNDVIYHVSSEDLPFGGIGPSGMGHYHGRDGFREFSHARAVFAQTKVEPVLRLMRPPYGKTLRGQLDSLISK